MKDYTLLQWIEQLGGLLLVLFVLLDVFVLVLYARATIGLLSTWLTRVLWRFFCWLANRFERHKATILSLGSPIALALLILTWVFLVTVGTALVIHPNLGSAVRATNGDTPRDFITALYVGGSSLSIVGASDFAPQTPIARLFFLFTSFIGISLVTLTLTYLMQLYRALERRNALGVKVHLLTNKTNDAAVLLAGLGPHGKFDAGVSTLIDLAAELVAVKESHHFYPLLFYFRFRETYYSVSQITLVTLDTVSLIQSALDDRQYGWYKQLASVAQLWHGSLQFLVTLADTFPPGKDQPVDHTPDDRTVDRWKQRYQAGIQQL